MYLDYLSALPYWILFADRRPTLALGLLSALSVSYLFADVFDPACFVTMSMNKSLQMDPHASRLVGSVTEYSATQGSSGFPNGHLPVMDAAILLLALKQGTRSLERYIAEYLALANGSELPDCMLIDFFCDGLNQTVRSKVIPQGPHSSRSNFLDYVLLTVGSAFTVGVAEERDTALNCMITAALEHAHKMVATTTPHHVIAASHESIQVTVDVKVPSQVTVDVKELSKVSVDVNEPSQVTADSHESSQVTADRHESSQVTADRHESSQVTADRHESSQVSADLPESLHVSADLPESLHVSADLPESRLGTADLPESRHGTPICQNHAKAQPIIQNHATAQLTFQSLFTSQLISPSLVTSCLPPPDIQGQSFSILVWHPV